MMGKRASLVAGVLVIAMVAGGLVVYRMGRPPSGPDVSSSAARGVVVDGAADGARPGDSAASRTPGGSLLGTSPGSGANPGASNAPASGAAPGAASTAIPPAGTPPGAVATSPVAAPSARPQGGDRGAPGGPPGGGFDMHRPTPVQAAVARKGSIEVTIGALGTMTARNTATVRSRVDGLLTQILFREGQTVKAGDVLAQIDPRPYQVALDQVQGQLQRDQALLDNARVDLQRYRGLLAKDSIAKQQVDAQAALVRQYEGTVLADKGQVDNARLQLSFTKITAPISGRLGLRQVDLGNMVRASDTTGLVVITETQPITAVFAIPADHLPSVMRRLGAGQTLSVEAWSADGHTALATGKLISVDNQIDTTTGTVKLKAEFANRDNALFPNQFFNARLVVDTRDDVVLIPAAAVQRGSQGTFVYRIDEGLVKVVVVQAGTTSGGRVEVLEGLSAGDQVVIDGVDRLRDGAKVEVIALQPASGAGAAPRATARAGAPPNGR